MHRCESSSFWSTTHYHRTGYQWRMDLQFCGAPVGLTGAPQNSRHKNIFGGAPRICATKISTFCGAPLSVRHRNRSAGPLWRVILWRTTHGAPQKIKNVRHRNIKQKYSIFSFCCTNTRIYSIYTGLYRKCRYIWQVYKQTKVLINISSHIL